MINQAPTKRVSTAALCAESKSISTPGAINPAQPPNSFSTLAEALDWAATTDRGMGFHNIREGVVVRLSFTELRARAHSLAAKLLGLGLKRGDAVGIIALVHGDFVCAFFACQYAGLVAVPLPLVTSIGAARGYEQQLTRLLATSQARAAVGPASFLEYLRHAAEGLDLVAISTVTEIEARPPATGSIEPLGPAEISHIQFSSGSTAFPKGIQISQRALMANLLGIIRHGVKVTPQDRIVSWLPFYHDMGLIGAMLVPVVAGCHSNYLPIDAFIYRPLSWLKLISDLRATISFSPTFGYDLAARQAVGRTLPDLDLSSWRAAGLGGDMIQHPVLDRFVKIFAPVGFDARAFLPSYGLAESTLGVTFNKCAQGIVLERVDRKSLESQNHKVSIVSDRAPEGRDVVSCGYPLPGHTIEIRDEKNRILPDHYVGAVYVSGPSLMDGYFRDLNATRESLSGGGWLDTGDMGYVSKGALFITGRRKDMIILNARNIWPQDLEWHAEQSVAGLRTRDTAAFLHHDELGQERAVLLVQCRLTDPAQRLTLAKDVQAAVLRNVGVDCQVELVPTKTLPFTTSGKLMRAQARLRWLEMKAGNNHPGKHAGNGQTNHSKPQPTAPAAVSAIFGDIGEPGAAHP